MKRLVQPRWLLPLLVLLALVLVACERPINSDSTDPTADPILPATLVPTTDPGVAPTTDPAAATAVPDDTTPDPATEATPEPGAEATTPPESTEPRGEVTHTVTSGDTITGLSVLYDIPVDVIVAANNLTNIDALEIGQQLIIPAEGTEVEDIAPAQTPVAEATTPPPATEERTHIVQAGENLFRIGLQYGFSFEELAAYNNIPNPHVLDVGQVIKIPPGN
ncbi:LysM peptidoglycan-binding domain-containing protein [Candidatus Leptofilum sp.]|uniref:LysM peptidoglycan-binding domain-containing protein n=1 Tax=Candidatus Leptofilum sp. TaxID=3241576 RepID=UPI003B5B2009